jgi:hypothetical protein
MSSALTDYISNDVALRSQIISIGIPILLPNGKTLLRGNDVKIPAFRGINELEITPENIDDWARNGWIDLRTSNMEKWKYRLNEIKKEVELYTAGDTSSRNFRTTEYWSGFNDIDAGKIVGWVFTEEEKGKRMKS